MNIGAVKLWNLVSLKIWMGSVDLPYVNIINRPKVPVGVTFIPRQRIRSKNSHLNLGSDTLLYNRYSIPWLLMTHRGLFEHSDQMEMKDFKSFRNYNSINTTSAFRVF